jgi:hypothetical protein
MYLQRLAAFECGVCLGKLMAPNLNQAQLETLTIILGAAVLLLLVFIRLRSK